MQITTNCLNHFNWINGKAYTTNDLKNPAINRKIGVWYLEYLENYFSDLEEPDRSVIMYSAYNMGQSRVKWKDFGDYNYYLVYRPYVQKIVGPWKWYEFKKKNRRIWKGRRVDIFKILEKPRR